jgi:pyruvate dehydrogenase E2 component (dihydrolipoamide acetyltransferase)
MSYSEPLQPKILKEIKMSNIRKTIAQRLSSSNQNIPSATLIVRINLAKLSEVRKKFQEAGRRVSFTAFIVKALARTLESHRELNAWVEDFSIKIFEDININVAINTKIGLYTPVIFNADNKPLDEISQKIQRLTEKANEGTLTLSELIGGTFTITNLGPYNIDLFLPIINPPQVAILGIGSSQSQETEDTSLKGTFFSLVFDHRAIDGVEASKFLTDLKSLLELTPDILVGN